MSCVDELLKKFDFIDRDTATRIVEQADNVRSKIAADRYTYTQARSKAKEEIAKALDQAYATKVMNAEKLLDNWSVATDPNFKGDIAEGIASILVGTTRNVKGRDFNVGTTHTAYRDQMTGWLAAQVKQKNLRGVFKDPKKQAEIVSQIMDAKKTNFKPSTDPAVIEAANLINQINNSMIQYRQGAGSTIKANAEHAFSQTHDINLIRADLNKWVSDILPKLDLERTFGDATITTPKAQKILREMFEDMEGGTSAAEVSILGGRRQLIFKSGQEFMEYNSAYGYNDLLEGLGAAIDRTARVGAMEGRLGSNPRQALEDLVSMAKKVQGGEALKGHFGSARIEEAMNMLSGSGERQAQGFAGNMYGLVQALKSLEVVAKMGYSLFSNFWDVPNSIMQIKANDGSSLADATGKYMGNIFESLGPLKNPQDRQFVLEAFDNMLSTTAMDLLGNGGQPIRGIPGALAKAATVSQTLNLNAWATKGNSRASGMAYGASILNAIETPKGSRSRAQREMIDRFGGLNSKEEAAFLRAYEIRAKEAGARIKTLGPGSFIGLQHTDVGLSAREFTALQQKTLSSFAEMMNPSIKAGSKENLMMGRNLSRDNPYRIVSEMFYQFKGSVTKAGNSVAKNTRAMNPSGELYDAGAVKSLAQYAVMGFMIAEGQRYVRGAIRGREYEPLSLQNAPMRAIQGVASSGMIYGPLGDALLGNHWHYYRGGLGDILGPIANRGGDYASFANALIRDPLFKETTRTGESKIGAQGVRLIKSHIPNHFLLEGFRAHMMEDVMERLRNE